MESNVDHGIYIKWANQTPAGQKDIDIDWAWSTYWHVNYDLAPALIGAKFWYSRGDDPNTPYKLEGNIRQLVDNDGGMEPCLILWSKKYTDQVGPIAGAIPGPDPTYGEVGAQQLMYWMQNMWFYQVYGKVDITPGLNVGASFTYAYADKKPTANNGPVSATNPEFVSAKYGKELDLTLRYKIYENLEYMIGAGYLWTGDYFKGTNPHAQIKNNYLAIHKLTLMF
jgi:hypothetical protein